MPKLLPRTPRARRPRGAAAPQAPVSVGASVPRIEGFGKVTGRARYVDDLRVPGMLHGRTVRSTVARGRIRRVELEPAFDWRGVVIADHRDIPGDNVVALISDDQPLLAVEHIRHAEEPILLLAHEGAIENSASALLRLGNTFSRNPTRTSRRVTRRNGSA